MGHACQPHQYEILQLYTLFLAESGDLSYVAVRARQNDLLRDDGLGLGDSHYSWRQKVN